MSSDISNIHTVDEGIENRVYKYITEANSLEELLELVKTKRYTYHRLSRMFTHILNNFSKDEALSMKKISYIRILGFNKNGQKYLNAIKKDIKIPILSKYKVGYKMLDLELRVTKIYSLINKKPKLITDEYSKKPIIK
jgi:predicted nucleotidyltransferase